MNKLDRLVAAYNASIETENILRTISRPVAETLVVIEMGVQRGLAIAVSIELGVEYDTAANSLKEGLL